MKVTAVGSWGFPSNLKRQIYVNNTCFDYTPPKIALSAPSYTVTGPVNVTANVSDDVGVTAVEFLVDGVYKATDHNAPFTYTFNAAAYPVGSHTVTAVARDGCGNSEQTKIFLTVQRDTSPPQVSISSPSAGAALRGTVNIQAQVSDDTGVARVEFYVDGAFKASDTAPPFVYAWAAAGDGPHTLLAKAFDGAGNTGTSAAVGVTTDSTAPRLDVSAPAFNQAVSGSGVRVSGWATDGSDAVTLTFTVDGYAMPLNSPVTWLARQDVCDSIPVGDSRCPYVGWRGYFDSSKLVNGWHTLEVTATDAAGWTAVSPKINFYVSNAISAVSARFAPTDDAWVRQTFPNTNYYGLDSHLGVRYPPSTGDGQYSFLKFNVTGTSGAVTSARLHLRTKTPLVELYLYKVDSGWTERTITWNTMPFTSAVYLTHRFNLAGSTWYDFDVTSYITGNGVYAFGYASADTGANLGCFSRETIYPPALEVTYRP